MSTNKPRAPPIVNIIRAVRLQRSKARTDIRDWPANAILIVPDPFVSYTSGRVRPGFSSDIRITGFVQLNRLCTNFSRSFLRELSIAERDEILLSVELILRSFKSDRKRNDI